METQSEQSYKTPSNGCYRFFEYETPKYVRVTNVRFGILRFFLQIIVIAFVITYQLWYSRGYQKFGGIEASVTTKVKGTSW